MFTDNEEANSRYRGYNPSFFNQAQARRRKAQRAAMAEASKKLREEREAQRERAIQMEIDIARREVDLSRREKQLSRAWDEVEAIRASALTEAMRHESGNGKPAARSIIAKIAYDHRMTVEMVTGPSRNKEFVEVRHKAIRAVADARPDLSLPQIGRIFKRDHTTILHVLRKTKLPGQVR